MRISSEGGEPERAVGAYSAFFSTIMNPDETKIYLHANAAAGAADSRAWASMLDGMEHGSDHGCINKDHTRKASTSTGDPVITLSREAPRFLIQVKEVNLTVEDAQREWMKSMSRNLVEETICPFCATGDCAATERIKNALFCL